MHQYSVRFIYMSMKIYRKTINLNRRKGIYCVYPLFESPVQKIAAMQPSGKQDNPENNRQKREYDTNRADRLACARVFVLWIHFNDLAARCNGDNSEYKADKRKITEVQRRDPCEDIAQKSQKGLKSMIP